MTRPTTPLRRKLTPKQKVLERRVFKAAMRWYRYASLPLNGVDQDLLEHQLSHARNRLFVACAKAAKGMK